MKRIAAITVLILAAMTAFAQGVRVDVPLWTSGPSVPVSGGPLPQSLLLANATVNICVHPVAPGSCTPVTTYTDVTLTTPCPSNSPIVQLPGTACAQTTGARGNLGFWYSGGVVDYFVHSSYGTFGPFTTSGGTTGPPGPAGPAGPPGSGNINPGQLALAQYPTSTASSVSPANFTYDAATGNNLTIPAGIFSVSSLSQLHPVADVTNPTYGAVGNGIHDDAPAFQAAKNALAGIGGGTLFIPKGTYFLNTLDTDGSSFVDITTDNIHVVCAPGVVLNSTSSTATMFRLGQIIGFGLQQYTIAGIGSPPKFAYQANTISTPGSPTITLTNPSNTANFAVGDPIYILGGPGTESNGDGELNWITAIDSIGGVLTLRKPTAKPYTGNLSNVGTPNVVTVADGAGVIRQNLSLEGCTANPAADFAYIGQAIGVKIRDNYVVVNPSATRGMLANSFYPMSDIEISGNSYTEAQIFAVQLADGWRDVYIHDNNFSSPYGAPILNVSQGAVDIVIAHNTMYEVIPSTYSTNTAPLFFSTAYRVQVNDNVISMANQNATNAAAAIATGLSNGVCHDCTFSNNIIGVTSATSNLGGGINVLGSGAVITGNKISVNNTRYGISTSSRNNVAGVNGDYAQAVITNNKITLTNTSSIAEGIIVGGTTSDIPYQGQAIVNNNYIKFDPGASGIGLIFDAAGGGDMSHNYIYGATTSIANTSGSSIGAPQMIGNVCSGITTTTTSCGQLAPDWGAQKFTGAVTLGALATPVMNNAVAKTTGGTLADTTQYCYQVQARNSSGYSGVPTEQCVTTGSSGGTNAVMVSWSAVPGATTYAIYGRTTGSEAHMSPDLNFTNTSFLDTGSITPSGATQATMPPPALSAGIITSGATTFTVSGCGSAGTITGNGTVGSFVVGTGAATCTFTVTVNGATGLSASHGWVANADDVTNGNHCLNATTVSTTTAVFTCGGTVGTSDVIKFSVSPY